MALLEEFGDSIESIHRISSMLTGFQNLTSKIISLTPRSKTAKLSTENNGRKIAFEYEVDTPIDAVDTATSGEITGDYEVHHEEDEEITKMLQFHSDTTDLIEDENDEEDDEEEAK